MHAVLQSNTLSALNMSVSIAAAAAQEAQRNLTVAGANAREAARNVVSGDTYTLARKQATEEARLEAVAAFNTAIQRHNKAKEAVRIFCFRQKGSLNGKGRMVRH